MNNSSVMLTEAAVAERIRMSPEYLAKYRKENPGFAAKLGYVGRSPRYMHEVFEDFCREQRGIPSDGCGSALEPASVDVAMDLSEPLLTTQQAAGVLGLQKSWFERNRAYYPERLPPGYRFGRSWRYSGPELRAWMLEQGRSRMRTC